VRRRTSFGELTVSLDITPTAAVRKRIDERDHLAAVASLRAILAPASVAVAGAAAVPGNVGRAVLANIIGGGFQGVVTPVNHAGGVVCSMRAARNMGELEVAPELVIIAAAGDEVLEFAADAAANGAKAVVVIPSDAEEDDAGSAGREQRLLEIVGGAGLRMVGPHSWGVLNTAEQISLNTTFTSASVRAGGLAIGSQSGGLGLLGQAAARQLGVAIFVSAGQPKPVVASVVRPDGQLPARTGPGVPNFLFPESCAAVLARAAERRDWLSRPLGEPPQYPDLDGAAARALIAALLEREPAGGWLSSDQAEALLATHGIPVAPSHRCRELERAVAFAGESGGPVALKADLAAPAHASDIGAVLLGLDGGSAVRSGWRELQRRRCASSSCASPSCSRKSPSSSRPTSTPSGA